MPPFPAKALAAASLLAGLAFTPPAVAEMAPAERAEIEKIVRDYLIANPEVLEEAFKTLETKKREEETRARVAAITENRDKIFDSKHQVVLGNAEGKTTLVEFFDYNCGYCKRALGDMLVLMEKNPDLRVVLKELPILGEGSVDAARVAVAVNVIAPDKYLDFHKAMFEAPGQANGEKALAIATSLGLDRARIEEAARSEATREALAEALTLAEKLGVSGTPSYVIGDQAVFGAVGYDMLQAMVEAKGKDAAKTN